MHHEYAGTYLVLATNAAVGHDGGDADNDGIDDISETEAGHDEVVRPRTVEVVLKAVSAITSTRPAKAAEVAVKPKPALGGGVAAARLLKSGLEQVVRMRSRPQSGTRKRRRQARAAG